MKIQYLQETGIALVSGQGPLITDGQSALELAMQVQYGTGARKLVLDKESLCPEFFILSTGVAGEVLQKFINYHIKAAIYGDFSHYTSKPLHDFLYESNQGKDFFFTATQEEAIERLAAVTAQGM